MDVELVLYYIAAKDLMRLHGGAGMHEPSLFAYAIRTIIPCAGSNNAHVS